MKSKKIHNFIGKYIPAPAVIIFIVFFFGVLLQIGFRLSPAFSDFYNRYVGSAFRTVMAKATDWIPFSLAEALLYFIPVPVVLLCIKLFRNIRGETRYFVRCIFGLLSVLAAVNSIFALNFAAGYHGSSLADKLELEDRTVTAQELYDTITIVTEQVNETAAQIDYRLDGSSRMPWDFFTLSDVLCDAYEPLYEEYIFLSPLNSNIKPLVISPLMTYTHISGVYSFYTGEANLNTNYPDYVCVYSAAHELAHQRGIAGRMKQTSLPFWFVPVQRIHTCSTADIFPCIVISLLPSIMQILNYTSWQFLPWRVPQEGSFPLTADFLTNIGTAPPPRYPIW